MKTNYNYELIKDYLDCILDGKTSKQVEELIANDETARMIAKGIVQMQNHFNDDAEIDNYLDQVLHKNSQLIKETPKKAQYSIYFKIAASILLIAVSGILIYRLNQPSLNDLVAEALAQPYELSMVQRNSETPTNLERGAAFYSQGNFTATIDLLRDEQGSRAILYRGLSHLYSANFREAVDELSKTELLESRFSEQAKWYLAMGYIKAEQNQKAKETLEAIIHQDQHYKRESAERILEKLIAD